MPSTLDDVRAAIATLDGRGLDLTRVVTLGHSAGGHLAAWAGHAVDAVTHVISQAGVLDLVAADRDGLGGGAVAALLGHPAGPADAEADPRQQLPLDVPVWCVHATDDDTVPISQSGDYVAAATAAGRAGGAGRGGRRPLRRHRPGPRRLAAHRGDPRRDRP